jgi:hypothetical protein
MADASEPPLSALDTAFKPYAIEIGFLLREWNDLQERFDRSDGVKRSNFNWHRWQRMLSLATKEKMRKLTEVNPREFAKKPLVTFVLPAPHLTAAAESHLGDSRWEARWEAQ